MREVVELKDEMVISTVVCVSCFPVGERICVVRVGSISVNRHTEAFKAVFTEDWAVVSDVGGVSLSSGGCEEWLRDSPSEAADVLEAVELCAALVTFWEWIHGVDDVVEEDLVGELSDLLGRCASVEDSWGVWVSAIIRVSDISVNLSDLSEVVLLEFEGGSESSKGKGSEKFHCEFVEFLILIKPSVHFLLYVKISKVFRSGMKFRAAWLLRNLR